MKLRKLLPLLLFFLFISAGMAEGASTIEEKVDEYLKTFVKNDRFSGVVLIAQNDEIVLSKGYGYANRELGVKHTPEMKFRLGSITKQFTTMAIMQLHEKEKLSIYDPISHYLPDYPDGDRITIHHLMSHTAGIPSFTSFPDYTKTMMIPATPEDLIDRFRDKPLEFEPGEKFSYSNSGYILLGYILEKVAGQPYEDYVREHIFEVAGIHNSGYDNHSKIILNRASGYERKDDKIVNASYIDMSIPHAAGALYSTVGDLYKWDRILYTNRLLDEKLMENMFTPVHDNYAYGWTVSSMFDKKVISHGGGINGFHTNIARFVDDDVCIIVLSNIIPAPVNEITRDLAAIVFDKPYEIPKERTAIQIPEDILKRYAGEYQLSPTFILSVTVEGNRIYTQATGQQRVEIYPASETEFFLKVVEAEIHFTVEDDGTVSGLILHQGGMKMPAERME